MFETPSCPNCGSTFFVRKLRTDSIFFGHTLEGYDFHRCYRCFTKFSPNDEDDGEPAATATPCEIRDVDLDLKTCGTKREVERFAVTVENAVDRPIRVDRTLLTFDDESAVAPIQPFRLDPGEVESIDVRRSWLHRDQQTVTVSLQSDGEVVATADVGVESQS
jgi:hypothetical protein